MSFKYQVVKESNNRYVLPPIAGMKVPVIAFLSQTLYDASDEGLWKQARQNACAEGVVGVYLMPDTHTGYSIPVGGVVITENTILQAGSGYDISCGVIALKVPGISSEDVASWDKREKWIKEVEFRVALGVGSHRPAGAPHVDKFLVEEIFRYGAKAVGVGAEYCERQYIPIPENIDFSQIEKAYAKAEPQLGSVGGGNHHIELEVDKKSGEVWIIIHCGSRGFGWETANHFFKRGADLRGIPAGRKEEAWLYADEALGKEYWTHHNGAANYAIANRHMIVHSVREATRKVFKADPKVYFEISHNLVQEETLALPDGTTKRGFVHRKGATRAFPAGHPDLIGTVWNETGHPCLIPGSMYEGSAILFPLEGAYKSACSVNHGAGRRMGRNDAKRRLSSKQEYIDKQMRTVERKLGGTMIRGIVGNTTKTPIDECGAVYKDLDEVLNVLVEENIARIDKRMYPVANLKGAD